MRTAIYLRVSTRDKGQDTENQAIQLRDFCKAMKHEIVIEYLDKASATGKVDRDSFKVMLADASKRKFDLVLFWSLDRFCREGVLKTLNYLQLLADYGIAYKSYTEQFLDTCGVFKDAVVSILATIAKQESIRISERVKAGMARAKMHGTQLGRKRVGIASEKVVALRQAGASWPKIALQLGIGQATAIRLYRAGLAASPESPQFLTDRSSQNKGLIGGTSPLH